MTDLHDDAAPRHAVRLGSPDAGAEILVLDARRRKLAGGIGSVNAMLADGVYKARFQAGDAVTDILFEVAGGPLELAGPPLSLSSPAPLSGTSTNHDYHAAPARLLHQIPIRKLGEGSEIRVFVRNPAKQLLQGPALALCQGLRIATLDGETLLDLGDCGATDVDAGFSAGGVGVPCATYLLTQFDEARQINIALPVFAGTGWTTMVFLDLDRSRPYVLPDLASASVVLCRIGTAFDPDSPQLRLLEFVKRSLADARPAVDAERILGCLRDAGDNPMLGILAGHALLLDRERHAPALSRLLDALLDLVPDHPDVVALQLALGRSPGGAVPVRVPMLQSSWDILVRHSIADPAILDGMAWLHRADVVGSGRLWVTWQTRPESRASSRDAGSLLLRLAVRTPPFLGLLFRYRIDLLANLAWNTAHSRTGPKDIQRLWRLAIRGASRARNALLDSRIAATPLEATIRRLLLALLDEEREEQPDLASIVRDLRVPVAVLISATLTLLQRAANKDV